jgi:hypothetical protein
LVAENSAQELNDDTIARIYKELNKNDGSTPVDPSLLGLAVAAIDMAKSDSGAKPFQVLYRPAQGGRLATKCLVDLPLVYAKKASKKKASDTSKQHWIRKKSSQIFSIAKHVAGVDSGVAPEDDLTSRDVIEHIVE